MSQPSNESLTNLWKSFSNNSSKHGSSISSTSKLSIISAEVDDMISRPDHPNDNMYPPNEYIPPTDPNTYYDVNSFDEDYDEYNDGYPEQEELDDCMYSSEEEN